MVIYGLFDPRSSELRYIGFTSKSLPRRLCLHINESKTSNTHKSNWIKSLIKENLKPEISLLQETNLQEYRSDERWNIEYFRSLGCNLTNATLGGEGVLGLKFTPQSIEKMRHSHLGKMHTQEQKEKIRQSNIKTKSDPIVRRKMSLAMTGFRHSSESKQKIRIAATGRKMSRESVEKTRSANTGIRHSEESRDRHSAAGRRFSDDIIEQIKELRKNGIRRQDVAAHIGIKISTRQISQIANNRSRHLQKKEAAHAIS
jgi:hypothetical protein